MCAFGMRIDALGLLRWESLGWIGRRRVRWWWRRWQDRRGGRGGGGRARHFEVFVRHRCAKTKTFFGGDQKKDGTSTPLLIPLLVLLRLPRLKYNLLPIPPKSKLPSQGFRALLGYIEVPHMTVENFWCGGYTKV